MAEYAPPPGPPPPKVPEGWKAVWNDQYKEWFYVNVYTKQSQWDKPEAPVYAPPGDGAPAGPPPGYDGSTARPTSDSKNPFTSGNNPAGAGGSMSEDERLARKLQDEENARAGPGSRGMADDYYASGGSYPAPQGQSYPPQGQSYPAQTSSTPYNQPELPPRDQKRGFFDRFKHSSSSSRPQYAGGYAGGGGGYPPQGYPPQQYPQQGYAPQGGYYQQQQQQPQRHGLGAGGGAALGLGAGLIGGALLMDGMDHMEDNAYDQGYQQGADNGGGDDGGGDDGGGGDFGGGDDGGGGDFGGGDF